MSNSSFRAMLVTVGGTSAPAIHILNERQPRFICFFVSRDSKPLIDEKILPALTYQPAHWDWITTDEHQSLIKCYQALIGHLPQILEKWEVKPSELSVEYTGGTKPMSVAAVLATIDHSSSYFYVGSRQPSDRDREGIGVVLDGKEYSIFEVNPWDELAVQQQKTIAFLFNLGRFEEARELADRLRDLTSDEEKRRVYDALSTLIEGYALWDRFEYKEAQRCIYQALEKLKLYAAGSGNRPLQVMLQVVEEQVKFLRQLNAKGEDADRLDILDMLSNASRRARARRYDDATARLYSLLEAIARYRLKNRYQISTSRVMPDQIPAAIQADFVRRLTDPENPDKGLRLGLLDSYQLLEALGDELGQKYRKNRQELDQVLHARNQSRLAHGRNPVKPEDYEKIRQIVMEFAQVTEEEILAFPTMAL